MQQRRESRHSRTTASDHFRTWPLLPTLQFYAATPIFTNKGGGLDLCSRNTGAQCAFGLDEISSNGASVLNFQGECTPYADTQAHATAFSRHNRSIHNPGRNAVCPRLPCGRQAVARHLGPLGAWCQRHKLGADRGMGDPRKDRCPDRLYQ